MAGRLSSEQVEFFRREGYLLFDQPVLPQAKFDALKSHFEKKVVEFVETTGKSPEHFDVPHFEDPHLFTWLFDDAVLDVVESLIGLLRRGVQFLRERVDQVTELVLVIRC